MIVRKMCNNATKKYPKNYDPMARQAQMEMDEVYQISKNEIEENANSVDFDEDVVDSEIVSEEEPEFMKGE